MKENKLNFLADNARKAIIDYRKEIYKHLKEIITKYGKPDENGDIILEFPEMDIFGGGVSAICVSDNNVCLIEKENKEWSIGEEITPSGEGFGNSTVSLNLKEGYDCECPEYFLEHWVVFMEKMDKLFPLD